jgi:hypothetical protein
MVERGGDVGEGRDSPEFQIQLRFERGVGRFRQRAAQVGDGAVGCAPGGTAGGGGQQSPYGLLVPPRWTLEELGGNLFRGGARPGQDPCGCSCCISLVPEGMSL